mgnify:CR=1 FL=1
MSHFLDKEVLELAQTLPLQYKVDAPKTKIALRAAAERVIRSKTAERKTWFPFRFVYGSKKRNIIIG